MTTSLPSLDVDSPVVSVAVPMLNEARYIEDCLAAFAKQSWPKDKLDIIVIDAGSTDGSRETVERLAVEHPWVRVVDNPRRKAAAAFNVGLTQARGEVFCLFSAHGVADPHYVEQSVAVLRETGVAGVGGVYEHEGTDRVSQAIGLAMTSPFGMASPHRFAVGRKEVDTISHPAYVTAAARAVGSFDETLERNSDYEFNWRVRAAGGRLLFDPTIVSVYRPRSSLKALARQFWWYGRWKARVVQRHPDSLRPRHLVAPAAVGAAALTPVLITGRAGRRVAAGGWLLYAALVALAVFRADPGRRGADPRTLATAFPVMHLAWGAGYLASSIEDRVRR